MIKYYIIGVLAFGALLIGSYFLYSQREAARLEQRLEQERSNAELRKKADQGTVDYDTCDRAGGVFNFRTRTCKLP